MLRFIHITIVFIAFFSNNAAAETFYVTSQQEFDNALSSAIANDEIIWRSGTYSDIFMDIEKSNLVIKSEELGTVIFNGASRVDISSSGDYITLQGFQFIGGDIGTSDVINTRGSYGVFNQINIRAYTCYKYLRVREESQYCEITYCNFENRLNQADQNILSILVSENQPGYHKIQYCSFKNFAGGGNDEGVEPIRIGVSTQADFISRTLVEYCYFTKCDGDGEIISSKATQNVYRFNTFEDNPKAELVLRHGSEAIVYGNFFLNGKGGVRVREGQDHYIYNNYFYQIDDRPIFLQNDPSDPLDNINIAFNTIVDCDDLRLGGTSGDNKPTNVTFSNNIFSNPQDNLFENPTGMETWIGNIGWGSLGLTEPASGMMRVDPKLVANESGYFGLSDDSPAINAAESGYASLPQFEGMDNIDMEMLFDMMGQDRPQSISDKDLGCNEYPHNTLISPIATEENTGPAYNSSMVTSITNPTIIVDDLIEIMKNPVSDKLNIKVSISDPAELTLEIYNLQGTTMDSINLVMSSGTTSLSRDTGSFVAGVYMLVARSRSSNNAVEKMQTLKFVKF